jgi:hypothetical protein
LGIAHLGGFDAVDALEIAFEPPETAAREIGLAPVVAR